MSLGRDPERLALHSESRDGDISIRSVQFTQPWQFNMGLQMKYDFSPRVTANVTVANLVNACFGGSNTAWSRQFPPSSTVCGYSPNVFYISNFYNGTGPNDTAANGVPLNPYFQSGSPRRTAT